MRGLIGLLCLWLVAGAALPARAEPGRAWALPGRSAGRLRQLPHPEGPAGRRAGEAPRGGLPARGGGFGTWITPNITPDPETGIGRWTDEEVIRAIREGRGRDGKTLGPPMPLRPLSPAGRQRRQGDGGVPAHGRARPAGGAAEPVQDPAARRPTARPWASVPDPPRQDPVKYGEYLAGPVAHCVECHTPFLPEGRPDTTRLGAGGFPFHGPWGVSYAANLTPDPGDGPREAGRTARSSPRSTAPAGAAAGCSRRCRPSTTRRGSPRGISARSWPTSGRSRRSGTRCPRPSRRRSRDRRRGRARAVGPASTRRPCRSPSVS